MALVTISVYSQVQNYSFVPAINVDDIPLMVPLMQVLAIETVVIEQQLFVPTLKCMFLMFLL